MTISDIFKKVVLKTGDQKSRSYFICQLVDGCSFKSGSFTTLLKHLEEKRTYFVHPGQICLECNLIMDSACEVMGHFRRHLEQGIHSFSYTPEKELCAACKLHWTYFNQIIHYNCK